MQENGEKVSFIIRIKFQLDRQLAEGKEQTGGLEFSERGSPRIDGEQSEIRINTRGPKDTPPGRVPSS